MSQPTEKLPKYRTPAEDQALSQMLDALREAEAKRRAAQRRVDDAVASLRAEALDGSCLGSWESIARILGITRQGAQQRYNRLGVY